MNAHTERRQIAGPVGEIECAIDEPAVDAGPRRGVVVICHPNPTQGGTMDNKVVQTIARGFVQLGYRAVRFNFRGIGQSQGGWDEGRGEVDDALAVVEAFRDPALPLALAGFSFGGFVASQAALRLAEPAERLLLVGPAASRFGVATVPADTVVIHGEQDDVVPLTAVLDWARPQALPVIVVPGVGHFFHGQLPLLKNLVLRSWHSAGSARA
ncbi:alpha/beta hydrolase [Roseateles amylovorans]|uniref:Alpha/beta fold hydrolase n=1 Tax=Roseateles amylovorans TaxID=2978473 RepID=A0ABY6B173_9BURK|nr:alpha/beta fold hydrolase [Roseateles amylovorans]UXH77946.1 alpha/beta fold hydrolase [Roseateles amylovorans]